MITNMQAAANAGLEEATSVTAAADVAIGSEGTAAAGGTSVWVTVIDGGEAVIPPTEVAITDDQVRP